VSARGDEKARDEEHQSGSERGDRQAEQQPLAGAG
jgi:hypothetical protein